MADVETGERPQLANLMGMAATAERAGNHEEAISYYNRVLEADPAIPEAWLGKGRAAGWLSSIAQPRIAESLVAFGNAIGCAADDAKAPIAARAHDDLTALATALYKLTRQHYTAHRTVAGVRTTYVQTTSQLVDALSSAHDWKAPDRPSLELMETMCRELLDTGVSEAAVPIVRAKREEARAGLAALDPAYQAPALADRSDAQKAEDKATMDGLGWIVAVIVMILGPILLALAR